MISPQFGKRKTKQQEPNGKKGSFAPMFKTFLGGQSNSAQSKIVTSSDMKSPRNSKLYEESKKTYMPSAFSYKD